MTDSPRVSAIRQVAIEAGRDAAIAATLMQEVEWLRAYPRPDSGVLHPVWSDGFMDGIDAVANHLETVARRLANVPLPAEPDPALATSDTPAYRQCGATTTLGPCVCGDPSKHRPYLP